VSTHVHVKSSEFRDEHLSLPTTTATEPVINTEVCELMWLIHSSGL